MTSGKNLKCQLPMTGKISPPGLIEIVPENKSIFPVYYIKKHVTGEPYILTRNDRYSGWRVVRICESTVAKDETFQKFNDIFRLS